MKASQQVEAATARYIDSLGPAALQKAHDYTVGKQWMLLWGLLVAAVVTWLVVRSGVLDKLAARIAERRRNLRAFLISLMFFLVSAVLTLPWTVYASYFREKGYGRTSQPLGDFLGQLTLSTVITSVITALFMIGVYWLIRRGAGGSGRAH
jgi:STE24 endopeptidase